MPQKDNYDEWNASLNDDSGLAMQEEPIEIVQMEPDTKLNRRVPLCRKCLQSGHVEKDCENEVDKL